MPTSASALERYTYCPLSWWLSRSGVASEGEAARAGHERHRAKGRVLAFVARLRRVYERTFDAAVLFTLFASSAALFAIDVLLFDPWHSVGLYLLLLSLLCLLAALVYLARALRARQRVDVVRAEAGIIDGEVTYTDLDRPAEVLHAPKYDLTGKPDYIVRRGDAVVPVEVKTGRSPATPHPSHRVQLAAYCLLVQETTGTRPPYGILTYDDRSFEVPFDEAAEREVLVTLLRMRLAESTHEVHRTHRQPRRCSGCSRRAACSESLV